jgi:hypothetical protein
MDHYPKAGSSEIGLRWQPGALYRERRSRRSALRSKLTQQGFCAQCGSRLTRESERLPTETHFHVGTFDQAERFQPVRHIFPEERLPWLHLGDA